MRTIFEPIISARQRSAFWLVRTESICEDGVMICETGVTITSHRPEQIGSACEGRRGGCGGSDDCIDDVALGNDATDAAALAGYHEKGELAIIQLLHHLGDGRGVGGRVQRRLALVIARKIGIVTHATFRTFCSQNVSHGRLAPHCARRVRARIASRGGLAVLSRADGFGRKLCVRDLICQQSRA